jgi:hypothetical protein
VTDQDAGEAKQPNVVVGATRAPSFVVSKSTSNRRTVELPQVVAETLGAHIERLPPPGRSNAPALCSVTGRRADAA